jgi:hypothetical protein
MATEPSNVFNTPPEFFQLFEHNWRHIQKRLTATWSARQKAEVADDYDRLINDLAAAIDAAVATDSGDLANEWKKAQIFVRSLLAELRMWIAIKDDDAGLAWRCFCDAEDYARMSARWLPDFMPAQEQPQRLRDVERVCFPRQPFFLSTATIVAEDDMFCTICDQVYAECEHIVGNLYCGRIASRRITHMKSISEISFVDEPADKRCRVFRGPDGHDPLTGEPAQQGNALKQNVEI